jgi:aspartate carbamoyltransferase catalytic subunit
MARFSFGRKMFKNFISTSQFANSDTLEQFFKTAVDKIHYPCAAGLVMASWFGESSTRTKTSFESAMLRLGGSVIRHQEKDSSILKGETWEDTVKALSKLCDIIVARTDREGDAARAVAVSKVPFISAGDGQGEHPTQALLDVYTIWKEYGTLDKISIGLVGDLKYSRTIHSLLKLLGLYDNITYHVLCPDGLYLDPREFLRKPNLHFRRHKSMDEMVETGLDVVYMTRNQSERRNDNIYIYDPKLHYLNLRQTEKLPNTSIIMHPLPRGPELSVEVDSSARARYWQQVENGLHVRMALLDVMLTCSKN